MVRYVRGGRLGAVIVGSHVKKTTLQLEQLLKMSGIAPIEVNVEQLPSNRDALLAEIVRECDRIHAAGKTPVVFTSRLEKAFLIKQRGWHLAIWFLPF